MGIRPMHLAVVLPRVWSTAEVLRAFVEDVMGQGPEKYPQMDADGRRWAQMKGERYPQMAQMM